MCVPFCVKSSGFPASSGSHPPRYQERQHFAHHKWAGMSGILESIKTQFYPYGTLSKRFFSMFWFTSFLLFMKIKHIKLQPDTDSNLSIL